MKTVRMLVILVLAFIIGLTPDVANAKLVACVGDSITFGTGIPDRESNCYPAQLATILQSVDSDWETQNFGHSGATLLRNKSASYVIKTAYSLALTSEPDVVVIQLGTNDCARATSSEIEQRFISDYLALIDDFAQLPSQPRIFVCYPPPIYPNNFGYNNTVLTDLIIPLIEQLPTYRAVEIIDLYTPLENSRHLFIWDGLHPNAEGARMIAETVAQPILSLRFPPDFNGDGIVDINDLIRLIESWGTDDPLCDIAPEPFGDGIIDAMDLEILMSFWQQEIFPPELIAYWKMDEEEGDIAYNSISDNYGIISGNPIWRPDSGQISGSLEFDGIDDYVETGFVLDPADGAFSVFAWIKGGAAGQVLLSQTGGANWLSADLSEGNFMTELVPPTTRTPVPPLVSDTIITDGNWHHIGFVWYGSHRTLFVDGVVVAEDMQNNLAGSTNGLYIGVGKGMELGTSWSGLVDDVRIYDEALSLARIETLAQ